MAVMDLRCATSSASAKTLLLYMCDAFEYAGMGYPVLNPALGAQVSLHVNSRRRLVPVLTHHTLKRHTEAVHLGKNHVI